MFGFGKKVEETRNKINAAADEAAAMSKAARSKMNDLSGSMDAFVNETQETIKRLEKKADDAAVRMAMAEKVKICLLGVITICAGVMAVNSCRD